MAPGKRQLIISDLQIPFEAHNALKFAAYCKKYFKIDDEDVYNVGDEVDNLHGGQYPKDPNGSFSAVGELGATREKIKEWGSIFPKMKLCISNHGLRWVRKATSAEIPSQLLISYQEIIQAPPGWRWQDKWLIKTKHPFQIVHGMGYSGINGHRNAAMDAGISTAIGHLHSNAGIAVIRTESQKIWGFNTGCLIDPEAYAFAYGKWNRLKPCLGIGVVINDGTSPTWVPYE